MPTMKGLGVIWGVGLSSTQWAGGTIVANYDYSIDAAQKELMDAQGKTAGLVLSNIKKALTVEVIPASTSSVASAITQNILPAIGTTVTIADSASSDVDGAHGGAYIFISGTKRVTQDGETRLTFNLVQYELDLSATIS